MRVAGRNISNRRRNFAMKCSRRGGFAPLEIKLYSGRSRRFLTGLVRKDSSNGAGFTLIELLVVLGIISMLMGILLPVLGKAKRQARLVLGMSNQRQIVEGVNLFAVDNDDRYPESVATVGFGAVWNWSDPRKLVGNTTRTTGLHRSMSAYLRNYIEDADIMFCPNAPRRYKYLQESWDAGDDWDNPENSFPLDPVTGAYCFWWNYVGLLSGRRVCFRGPWGPGARQIAGERLSRLFV